MIKPVDLTFPLASTSAEIRSQEEKRKMEHAAVVEDLGEIKEKTVNTWKLIGKLSGRGRGVKEDQQEDTHDLFRLLYFR